MAVAAPTEQCRVEDGSLREFAPEPGDALMVGIPCDAGERRRAERGEDLDLLVAVAHGWLLLLAKVQEEVEDLLNQRKLSEVD